MQPSVLRRRSVVRQDRGRNWPVGLEKVTVSVEVAVVGSDAIGAVKNCEEIRQQVNQHQRPGRRGIH